MSVDTSSETLFRGDPARHVCGPPTEQSARVHRPQDPRPWSERRLAIELQEHLAALDDRRQRVQAALDVLRVTS